MATTPGPQAPGASKGKPERKTLLVPTGGRHNDMMWDGLKEVRPGDPDYEAEYRSAVYRHEHFDAPMPYA